MRSWRVISVFCVLLSLHCSNNGTTSPQDLGAPDGDGGQSLDGPSPSGDALLASLTLAQGVFVPAFSRGVSTYAVAVPLLAASSFVQAVPEDPNATLLLNGAPLSAGPPTLVNLPGETLVTITVRAQNGTTTNYYVNVTHTLSAYVKASNTHTSDVFGSVVALSSDTLAVGAPHESSNATGINGNQSDTSAAAAGAVYVYTRSGTTWVQQAYLKASNTDGADYFGSSLALDGDTLVVGAPQESSSATGVNGNQSDNAAGHSGAVYVFTRTAGVWSQQAYIKASNTRANAQFGYSVALSGNTLAVGSNKESSSATGLNGNQSDTSADQAGAAYVFTRSGTTWSQQAYVKASNTDAGDQFGYSVALSGDTLAIGAVDEDSVARGINGTQTDNTDTNSGAAYVFTRSGTTWTQQAYLKSSNSDAGDVFGNAMALDSDTLAVGAQGEDGSATGVNGTADNSLNDSGAVYVFLRSGTTWTQQAYVKASNPHASDEFGYSVALSGDRLAAGAINESGAGNGLNPSQSAQTASHSGAAYFFTRSGTSWSQLAYVKAFNTEAMDAFGYSIAVFSDSLAVGALYEDSDAKGIGGDQNNNNAMDSGAVYVY